MVQVIKKCLHLNSNIEIHKSELLSIVENAAKAFKF